MAALSSLYVELVSTAKGFSVGFDQASKDVNAFKQQTESLNTVLGKESAAAAQTTAMNMGLVASAVVGAVAAVGTTLVAMASHTAEFGDKLTDMAGRTGISVEELQKLGFAAEQSGSTMDAFANGLERLSRNAYLAAAANGEQRAVFNALHISVRDASGGLKSASDLTLEIADRFHSMQGPTEKTALAIALFGRSGADLVPTLNLGSEGIRELGVQLESVGGLMGGEAAEAGNIYQEKLNLLSKAMRGAGDQIGFYLIPKLIDLLDVITPLIRPTVTFVDTLLKLGTGNFLGALENVTGPSALKVALQEDQKAMMDFHAAAILSAEQQKEFAPIIDKHRESREKLSDAQKAANRIMEQERDEINKQGIALMNAEGAWMQYGHTILDQIPAMRRFQTEMDSIRESADKAAFILSQNLDMKKFPLLPGGALEPPPLAPPMLGSGEARTTGQFLEKWAEDAKKAAAQQQALADATKDVERSAGKVFDFLFLRKDKTDPSGDPLIRSVEALRKQGVALDANTLKWYEFAKAHSMQEGIDVEINRAKKAAEEYAAAHRTIFGKLMEGIQTAIEAFGISIGRSLFQSMAGQLFGSLKKGFDDFFSGLIESIGLKSFLSGLGNKLGGVFKEKGLDTLLGTGANAATGAANQAAQAATGASQAAGAAGGLMGTIGAIGAVGGAVGSIATAVGVARLEGTMNAVEYNTRATMIHSQVMIDSFFAPWTSIFEWSLNWAHESAMILDAIYNLMVAGGGVGGAAVAPVGGVTNNITLNVTSAAAGKEVVEYLDMILKTGQGGYRESWTMIFNQNAGVISTVPAG